MTQQDRLEIEETQKLLILNINNALKLSWPHLNEAVSQQEHSDVVIVHNGTSVEKFIDEIKWQKKRGRQLWACDHAFAWLMENGIEPDVHIISGIEPTQANLVPTKTSARLLYASQCHPSVFEKAKQSGAEVLIWHAKSDATLKILEGRTTALIGFGESVAMKAIGLAYILGYRDFYLFGFDSSFQGKRQLAFGDVQEDEGPPVTITMGEKSFVTSAALAQQAKDFSQTMPFLLDKGCQFFIQGYGLLPALAKRILNVPDSEFPDEEDIVKVGELWWPRQDQECRESVENALGDIHHIMKFCGAHHTVLQAGGNVGAWPIEFSKYFSHVITFEPDPLNYACLQRNTKDYPNIDKLRLGLSNKSETTGLSREAHNCGAHFVHGEGDIPLMRIDDLHLQNCDLIQLDIEGYEYKALVGGLETIRRFKPVIVTEEKKLGERYGVRDEDIQNLLIPLGYKKVKHLHRDVIYVADTPDKQCTLNVCCLKWGSKYTADYVNRLASMVKKNLKRPYRFVCFTDDPSGIHPSIECVPLLDEGLKGWWHKVSFFRPQLYDLKGTLLFLDLDLVIVDSLEPFLDHSGSFCIIKDWLAGDRALYNSSVFKLEIGSRADIYEQFKKHSPQSIMQKYPGDQEWISEQATGVTIWPLAWCVSFKWQCALPSPQDPIVPEQARIVVFHGKPDPHEAMNYSYKIYGPDKQVDGKETEGRPAPWIASYWNISELL